MHGLPRSITPPYFAYTTILLTDPDKNIKPVLPTRIELSVSIELFPPSRSRKIATASQDAGWTNHKGQSKSLGTGWSFQVKGSTNHRERGAGARDG